MAEHVKPVLYCNNASEYTNAQKKLLVISRIYFNLRTYAFPSLECILQQRERID